MPHVLTTGVVVIPPHVQSVDDDNRYPLTVFVTDDDGGIGSISLTSLNIPSNGLFDGAQENIVTGKIKESGPFRLDDNGGDEGFVGMRFDLQQIPTEGAIIDSAFIQFTVDDTNEVLTDGPLTVTFVGELAENAKRYDKDDDRNLSSRIVTLASVEWVVPPWLGDGDDGAAQLTPDLREIIQEIVDHPGWNEGDAINIMIKLQTGDGERAAEHDDDDYITAPEIIIAYHSEEQLP